jgi:predicted membrane-bound mannosyltransferase
MDKRRLNVARTRLPVRCAGGTFDELLHWGAIRRKSTFPTYAKTITYWVVTFLLVCFGGLIAFLEVISTDYTIKPLTVFVIGFSAPALVKNLSQEPEPWCISNRASSLHPEFSK